MEAARNIVVSGAYEGKKVVLAGDGAGIETKFKGTIYLDHTVVKNCRILWSERKQVRFLGVLLGFVVFLGLFIVGAFLEVSFTTAILGKDEVAGWFAYGLGGLGMIWGVRNSPWFGVYQIELSFQNGESGIVEIDEWIYRAMKKKISHWSEAIVCDDKEEYQAKEEPAAVEEKIDILLELEAISDTITDKKMSEQVDRIRDVTEKILNYQEKRPEKAALLHSFLSYYLPATLRILKTYGELEGQGVSGGNITRTMERIEGMMDRIVACFEEQLDRLYQGEAMDIAAEAQVLERMIAKDGLTGEQDFSL